MVKDVIDFLIQQDPQVGNAVKAEYDRQRRNIELIASENFVSEAVLAAASSVLTNKYAEGYPGKRYYGGCECVDVVEEICPGAGQGPFRCRPRQRAAPQRCLRPTTPSTRPCATPGDTVMGMNLANGGHLTHGSPVNYLRQQLQHRPLRRGPEDRAASTTIRFATWPSSTSPR